VSSATISLTLFLTCLTAELQKDTVNQERRIAEKKNEVKVAEDRLEALRNERQSNLLVVHAVHGEISVLSSTLANLHARVVGIEAMHRDIVKENKHLHGVNAVTLDALATFEGKHTKLMSISHEVRGQVSAETQMLATKSAHHATVSANLENLKQEEIILQDSVSKAANEVVKVLDSNRQIEDMQGHHQLSCRSMQTQIAFAEQTLNNLQAREESLATEVFSLALSAQNTMARNETSRELELNNIAAATITAVRLAKEKIANCVEEYSQSSKKKAEQQKKYSRTRELAEKLRRVKIDVSNMHSQRVRLEQAKASGEAKREQQRAVLRRYEETLRLKAMHGKILELGDEIAIALETALKSCQSVTAITPIVFTEIVRRLKTVEALSALAERFVGYDPSSKYERTSTTLRAQRTVMKSNWTPNAETGMGERDHDCGHSGQAIDGGRKPCHPYTKSEGKGFGHKAADDERVTAAHAERKATERRRTRSSVTNA
jgi:hypothetical protein